MSNHTPGPWVVNGLDIDGPDEVWIANVCGQHRGIGNQEAFDEETAQANAHILGASLALYEALVEIRDALAQGTALIEKDGKLTNALEVARAAIAKVEGVE